MLSRFNTILLSGAVLRLDWERVFTLHKKKSLISKYPPINAHHSSFLSFFPHFDLLKKVWIRPWLLYQFIFFNFWWYSVRIHIFLVFLSTVQYTLHRRWNKNKTSNRAGQMTTGLGHSYVDPKILSYTNKVQQVPFLKSLVWLGPGWIRTQERKIEIKKK